MKLSARILKDVNGVNSFRRADQAEFTAGDALTVYFQLIDTSLDRADEGFVPAGRRYVPAAGAALTVVLDHLDDARKITRVATQPYAQDTSIFAISILATDVLSGTVNLKLDLNEGGVHTYGMLQPALLVSGTNGTSRWGPWTPITSTN